MGWEGWNGLGWKMSWDGIRGDEVGLDGVRWNGLGWGEMEWDG